MAWDLSKTTYASKSFAASTQVSFGMGVAFKADGTKMYVLDDTGNKIYQYSLSTAWDVSTATYDSKSLALTDAGGSGVATGLFLKPDGTKVFTSQYSAGTATLFQRTLATPWDITSAGAATSKSITATFGSEQSVGDIFLKSDGTRAFFAGITTGKVQSMDLATAWDITSAWSNTASSNTNTETSAPDGIFFKDDGTKLFTIQGSTVYQYTLGTAWSIAGASYDSISLSTAGQEGSARGVAFRDDGTSMYVVGDANNTVYQYTVGGFVPQIIMS